MVLISTLLLEIWNAGVIQLPQLHWIPDQLKYPSRAPQWMHDSFPCKAPSSAASWQAKADNEQADDTIWTTLINMWCVSYCKGRILWGWITWSHPLQRLNIQRRAIFFFVVCVTAFPFVVPLEARVTLPRSVADNIVLRSNNPPTFLAAVCCFMGLFVWQFLARIRLLRNTGVVFQYMASYFLSNFVGLACEKKKMNMCKLEDDTWVKSRSTESAWYDKYFSQNKDA